MKTIENSQLPASVQRPTYDRHQLKSRIVHLGFGAFHRAHQALLTNRVLQQSGGDWGICEVNLFGGEVLIETLRQQNHLYSVLEKGAESNQALIIGSVTESLHSELDGMESVIEKMAEPQVAIVSMTITEKGYCVLPGGGGLDVSNALIKADLLQPQQPKSAIGVIVEALRRRRERGLVPFTVLSCDNIPENGHIVKQAVIGLAKASNAELADWINQNVPFPSTMVDRIVPAITDETLAEIEQALGVSDPCGIACEPFIQWVVEDNFIAGRPQWETIGAELVDNVLPYEEMKLRMLNGSHSFLAYLGYLAGYQHINDCMTDSAYRTAAHRLMLQEQAPTLSLKNVDLASYADRLIERYSNPSLKHRTWQIAMDGTQKLPQRMLDSVRWHLAHNSSFDCLALGIAGWMRYVGGMDDAGTVIDVRDPMAERLKLVCASTKDGIERVQGLLAVEEVFGAALPQEPRFVEAVTRSYLVLMVQGAKNTVHQLVSQGSIQ
ncbi:fructuronate reductase [Budviciaceae bacterium BWR-B9]|uniref:Fructuronate reductase n=1 Tax=Limnobaculum allomyrinae TaxID=2791986 RepID=A0ABS1IRE7_9GAMM|nr:MULTISPECIES: fructuronate reductase [Limnobaculum]MBK5144326.1 fructuronate reductase [Limnobaculum allomyrinae]MBV7691929.1 fructuronate reductase [Limnobaculum sp. M2-1]